MVDRSHVRSSQGVRTPPVCNQPRITPSFLRALSVSIVQTAGSCTEGSGGGRHAIQLAGVERYLAVHPPLERGAFLQADLQRDVSEPVGGSGKLQVSFQGLPGARTFPAPPVLGQVAPEPVEMITAPEHVHLCRRTQAGRVELGDEAVPVPTQ